MKNGGFWRINILKYMFRFPRAVNNLGEEENMKKIDFRGLWQRYKRAIVSSSICLLAVVLVAVISATSLNSTKSFKNDEVQTSAPTSITFVQPVKDGEVIKDYSNKTLKYNSTLKQWEAHKAIDIKGVEGSDVVAVANGEVISVESDYLTGTVVTIKHSDKLQTVYGSLDEKVEVKVGDRVISGQKIGTISTSAKNEAKDGAHLHFEVLLDGIKVDPNLYLENSNK